MDLNSVRHTQESECTPVNMGFLMQQNKNAIAELKKYRRRTAEMQTQLTAAQQRERAKGDLIMLLSRHWSQVRAAMRMIGRVRWQTLALLLADALCSRRGPQRWRPT